MSIVRRGRRSESETHLPNTVGLDAPVSVRRLVTRFAFTGFVVVLVVAVVTAFASRSRGVGLAYRDAERVTSASAKAFIEPMLTDALLARDRVAIERLNDAVVTNVRTGSLVRVKMWTESGEIVYSDESRLIGMVFPLDDDDLAVLKNGGSAVGVTNLNAPENLYEDRKGKMVQVYQRVYTKEGTPLLFEAYFDYEAVREISADLWATFGPIALGSLVLLQLVQIPLAWRMAQRLRSGQTHRERLLSHAADASRAERQRIASDLHDGVVQDLTGVSMTMTAMTVGGDPDPRIAHAAETLRDAVKSMRSLLVDIYPPNLFDEGLEWALSDLMSGLRTRGVETQLLVDLEGADLNRVTTGLLYRSAQESIRNIVSHSLARHVRVTVSSTDAEVMLSIDDDGRGFSTNTFKESQSDGHVGLKALAGLVEDAGGKLVALSAEGVGTRVQVSLPLRAHQERRLRRDSRRHRR